MKSSTKTDFELLLIDSSRILADMAVSHILKNKKQFKYLMKLVFEDKYPASMRAARVADLCAEQQPTLLKPYFTEIVEKLDKFKVDGIKRGFVHYFFTYYILLNTDQTGLLVDRCFNMLNSPTETIAVKHYSSQILYKVSNLEPDLKNELINVLENQVQVNDNAVSKFGKILLKNLYKETKTI